MSCTCDYILPSRSEWEQHYSNCKLVWKTENGMKYIKNDDGTLRLPNDNLSQLDHDHMHHLGFDTKNYNLPEMFGDVKFVCMGGTKHRMKEFARHIGQVLKTPCDLVNLTKTSHRYAMYKVGPVLSVSHGIGISSMTILLQEVIKLLAYAKAKDPIFFRLGSSGGLNIPPGSVVISTWGLNGTLEKSHNIPIMGKIRKMPAYFDQRLAQELLSVTSDKDGFNTYSGGTMAADDFYTGQARLDGPFCNYTSEDKMKFLQTLCDMGVVNIEMEATALAALARKIGVRCGEVCVTFVNRFKGDQIEATKATLEEWQTRPMRILSRYISKYFESRK